MVLQLSPFSHLSPFYLVLPFSLAIPHLGSCPWVTYVSSLVTPFPILLLTSPCLLCTYNLYLIPVPFPPFSPFSLPTGNSQNDLHIYDSVSVLLVCFIDSIVDSCELISILMFIVLIFFFLYNSHSHFI